MLTRSEVRGHRNASVKKSDSPFPHEMCLKSGIILICSTRELIVDQQKATKNSKWDQIVTQRGITRHSEILTENVRDSAQQGPQLGATWALQRRKEAMFRVL